MLGWNVLVVLWGAYVRASGSGAGCGSHWPLCNGQVFPQAPQIKTIVEFTHRVTSGLALAGAVGLCAWAFRLFPRGHRARRAAAWSVIFLFLEAGLGAGLVLFDYVAGNRSVGRAIYLSAHLVNTQLLLGALTLTAWFAGGAARAGPRPSRWMRASLPVALLVSVTGAIAALGDTLFPAESLSQGLRQDFSPAAHFLLRLRVIHPLLAIAAVALFLVAAVAALRGGPGPAKTPAAAVAALAALQFCVGALNLALLAPVWMQLAHLLIANLLWIALVASVAVEHKETLMLD